MNIDFKEIEEKYPKGYNKFVLFMANKKFANAIKAKVLDIWFAKQIFCYCDFEKFFDDNGIIILIRDIDKELYNFEFVIKYKKLSIYGKNKYYVIKRYYQFENEKFKEQKRDEVKEKAIPKAFEILEQQIKE